jgi:prevent-host-death family protein
MMRRVTATEAKGHILQLLDEVAGGEEIEITRHGRIVARLMPAGGPSGLRGRLASLVTTKARDDQLFRTGAWD